MNAIDAIKTSVWAIASHAGDRIITGLGHKNNLGFSVQMPHIKAFTEHSESTLHSTLQLLGIDDDNWMPLGPEGIYDEVQA